MEICRKSKMIIGFTVVDRISINLYNDDSAGHSKWR